LFKTKINFVVSLVRDIVYYMQQRVRNPNILLLHIIIILTKRKQYSFIQIDRVHQIQTSLKT